MKRLLSYVMIMAIVVGLFPAGAWAEEGRGDPASWSIRYDGETGKAGYIDQNGEWVIPPRFDTAFPFNETGHAIVEIRLETDEFYDWRYGLIDATGAYAAQPVYRSIWDTCDGGRTFQSEDGSYGIMEADGSIRIPRVEGVDYLGGFTCAVADYRLGEKEGLIDAQGNKLTEALYDKVYIRDSGWVEIENEEKCGVMALDGKVVIPPTYDYIADYNISRTDLLGVYLNGKCGLASRETGELVLPCAFNNTDEANVALALGATSREEIYPECVRRCGELGLSVMWLEPGISIMRKPGVDRMVLLKGSLAAIYGLDGTAYTDYIFDVVRDFDGQGHAVALKNGKWGQIDRNGDTVVDFIYDDEEEAKAKVEVHFVSQWADDSPPYALAKRDGTVLTGYKYWSYTPFSNGFAMVADGENWAYMDGAGKEITAFKYMPMGSQFGSTPFGEDGLAIVQDREDLRRNIINSTGRELLPENYAKVWRAGCGLIGFSGGALFGGIGAGVGFIDGTGKVVIEPQYGYYTTPKGFMEGNTFDEKTGLASVWSDGGWITIDTQGNRVTQPPESEEITYAEGLTPANYYGPGRGWSGGPWGFQNEEGEWVVPQMFNAVGDFDHGYAAVRSADRYGLLKNPRLPAQEGPSAGEDLLAELDITWMEGEKRLTVFGKDNLVCEYIPRNSWAGRHGVESEGDRGLYNADGELLVPVQYGYTLPGGRSGYAGRWFILSQTEREGETVYTDYLGNTYTDEDMGYVWDPSEYEVYWEPSLDGHDKRGYADPWTGEILLPAIYDEAFSFTEGVGVVGVGEDWETRQYFAIDKEGNKLFDFDSFLYNTRFTEGLMGVVDKATGKCGFIDPAGTVVIPFEWEDAQKFSEGLSRVYQDGKYGYIDKNGELAIPFAFDMADYAFLDGLSIVTYGGRKGILKNPLLRNKTSDWASAEVAAATDAGYVTESCKEYQTFTITRRQFAELAVNYLEKATGKAISPAPADTFADTADESVLKAYAAGIVRGVGEGRFSPGGLLTREQLAAMLWRAMEKVGVKAERVDLAAYTDGEEVSSWAADSLSALVGLEVMAGTGANALSPKDSCTVEQAILLVYRAVK